MQTFLVALLASAFAWPIIIALVVLTWFCLEKGDGPLTAAFTLVASTLLWFKLPIIGAAIMDNPLMDAVAIVGYLVGSIVWARIKWSRLASQVRTKYVTMRDQYLHSRDLPADYFSTCLADDNHANNLASDMRYKFQGFDYDRYKTFAQNLRTVIPQAADRKADIVMWMAYWPLSLAWFILNDLLGDLFNNMYEMVKVGFQRIADDKFKDLV